MTQYTEDKRDRAVLVGLSAHSLPREECATEASMEELEALLETAGGVCVGMALQNRDAPEARILYRRRQDRRGKGAGPERGGGPGHL